MKRIITWAVLWTFLSATFWVNAWPAVAGPTSSPSSESSPKSPNTSSVPKISVTPTSINFGNLSTGTTLQNTVAIQNNGKAALVISSITLSGNNPSDFKETNSCGTIHPGSSCTVTVTFAPTSAGKKSATLSIGSNDPRKSTANVKLSGSAKASPCSYSLTS
jgi:hypothetical protein